MDEFNTIFSSCTTTFCIIFFSFSTLFSVFALSIYIFRSLEPFCTCDICKSYLTSSWTKDFDNLSDWYTHLLRDSPTSTIHVHVLGCTITANPQNVEHMLKLNFENYSKGKLYSTILGDFLGKGIFVVDGEHWRFQRKMASLELGSVSVRTYAFETVTSMIQSRLIPLLTSFSSLNENGGNSNLDLQEVFRKFSFDNICKFSFGLDPGCLELSKPSTEFDVAFDLASKLSAERALSVSPIVWKIKRFFNVGSERKLKESIKLVNDLANDMIRQKRKMGFSTQSDLLARFMGNTQDESYLRDIVVSFLLAGRDTVASGLTGFFWLLSNHPKIATKIRDEIETIMGKREEEMPSYGELREMHYLNAALHEAMRLLPPVHHDSKYTQHDDVLPDGTFVGRGTRVAYHPYAMGRMEELWGSDCLEFKPERWLNGHGIFVSENPFKYSVFQAGPRVCLGKEMAVLAMKSVAFSLVRRFDISHVSSTNVMPQFSPGLTASIKGGLPVTIRDRRSKNM